MKHTLLALLVVALPSAALADIAPIQIEIEAPKPTAVIDLGTTEAAAGLAVLDVRKIVMRNKAALRWCYVLRAQAKPKLMGKIVLTFDVLPSGKVAAATVSQTTVNDANLEQCMVRAAARWFFPKPAEGAIVRVTQPLVLSMRLDVR